VEVKENINILKKKIKKIKKIKKKVVVEGWKS
jgi:hypothetical protein